MWRLTREHWALVAGFLAASALMVGSIEHWHEVTKTSFIAGWLFQLSTLIRTIFVPTKTTHDEE
jgi:hypothetical protein